jgi:hypothetical protein
LTQGDQIIVCEQRLNYQQVLALTRLAAAVALVDVNAAVSPIYLAKLADYLWLRKPILALTPKQSGTTDILGPDYKLLVSPSDVEGATRGLNELWSHWKRGELTRLAPAPEIRDKYSPARTCEQFDAACRFVLSGPAKASGLDSRTSTYSSVSYSADATVSP